MGGFCAFCKDALRLLKSHVLDAAYIINSTTTATVAASAGDSELEQYTL